MRGVAAQLAACFGGGERRAAQRGGGRVPGKARRIRRLQRLPGGIGAGDLERGAIVGRAQPGGQRRVDVGLGGPQLAQMDGAAVGREPHGLLAEVFLGVASQREGDDQRRRHQEAQVQVRVDAAREIAVAGQHRHRMDGARCHGLAHRGGQGTGVADAGGAAIANDIEAHGGQVVQQAGALQVAGGGGRAGAQGRLDPWRHREARLARLASQEPRRHQQPRVRGVGAAGDGGDRDGVPGQGAARRPGRKTLIGQDGFRVAVGVQILRPLRSGHMHLHAVQRDLDHAGVARRGRGIQRDAGAFGIGADPRHVRFRPAGLAQVGQRFAVDGKVARRGSVFGRHVGHHAAAARRQRADARPEELHEFAGHVDGAQALGHGQGQIGRRHASLQRTGQTHADDIGNAQHRRHAEHDGLRLQSAHAPAEHADAVDHRRMAVGADHHVGVQRNTVRACLLTDHRGQLLKVDGVHDARARRVDAYVRQRLGRPAQETVTLGVASQFQVQVQRRRIGARVGLHRQRMVDRHVHR
ncbi:hypothetical protein D3C86_796600 [compost metagenome]